LEEAITGAGVGVTVAIVATGAAGEHAARSRQIESRRGKSLWFMALGDSD
jgi:F0F1-type ATP synthase membrane subunit c/vacuolar-type H+-ATPase subunit K